MLSMGSEVPAPLAAEVDMVAEKPVSRSLSNKKNRTKVPKKIHKAEREKLKRDHMNDLFLELGNALELVRENNGKASILGDATRLLRDLLAQVECLKRENVALASESHYVTNEKNELRDENSVLEAQIEKLQTELEEKALSKPTWDGAPTQSQLLEDCLTLPVVETALQPTPGVGPVFVIPVHHDLQAYPNPDTSQATSKLRSNVSRPHARYPTPSDLWPSQILTKKPKTTQENLPNSSNSTSEVEQDPGNL
ncbi:hypothetical protein HHK36_007224 [Tetracentron sinense]|uniref:BHLH domain-containing protein n=1 Tax=Tetracentron sinense TaxID=13715 RepID=A0A834ZMZ8_TETSI|nr:hypothetical protein HHK36_007224 [Tetracentron sinense]